MEMISASLLQALMTAYFSEGRLIVGKEGSEITRTVKKLTAGGLLVGTYFAHRKMKTKKKNYIIYYRNIEALSENIHYNLTKSNTIIDQKLLKQLSTSTLSEALKSLNDWGIIKYQTHTSPKTKLQRERHGDKKGIRIAVSRRPLKNVTSRINAAQKAKEDINNQ